MRAATAGAISVKVAALMEGAMKSMLLTRLKAAVVVVVLASVLGWGAGAALWQARAAGQQAGPIEAELSLDDEPMPDVSGTWQGEGWGTVVLRPTKIKGTLVGTYTDTFGKDVGRIAVRWSAGSRRYEGTWSEGKYRFGRIALEPAREGEAMSGAYTTDPKCEHQPGVPALASLRWTRARPNSIPKGNASAPAKTPAGDGRVGKVRAREGHTAWGKVVAGLQAGLGIRPGERRAYYHGETITLVVRIRNVGKKAVRFEYLRQFLDENPPVVTDANGKVVPQAAFEVLGEHGPVHVTLEPGKEIELESRLAGGARRAGASGLRYAVGPALGAGKVSFQYERVLGNSSAGFIKLDPALSKLATGKLELEIKAAPQPAASEKN
jgi:hypothetical protein